MSLIYSSLSKLIDLPSRIRASTHGPRSPDRPFLRPTVLHTERDPDVCPSRPKNRGSCAGKLLYTSFHRTGLCSCRSWRWEERATEGRPGAEGSSLQTAQFNRESKDFKNSKFEPCLPGKDEDTLIKRRD